MISEIAQISIKTGLEKEFEAGVAKAVPVFLRAKGLAGDFTADLRSDDFFSATKRFFTAPISLLQFGRTRVNAIWENPTRLNRATLEDAAVALEVAPVRHAKDHQRVIGLVLRERVEETA